jgi:hypothetical protein
MASALLAQALEELQRIRALLEQAPPGGSHLSVNDLDAARARRALLAGGHAANLVEQAGASELLTREEAARYTRRSPKTFDKTIRCSLSNRGTPRRPLYSKKEIDRWLNATLPLGHSAGNPIRSSSKSASRTAASVSKSRQARQILKKLNAPLRKSTPT